MVGAFLFRPSQQNHAARSPGERVSVCRIAQPPERPGDPLPENVLLAESRFASDNRSSRSTAAPTPICETKPKRASRLLRTREPPRF